MSQIQLKNVSNVFLKEINLDIADGELMALVGPSGSGKSTLLNVIAGLIPSSGHIHFDGGCINGVPAYRRNVGYVLQDLYLFPHLTVRKNIQLALTRFKQPAAEKRTQVDELLTLFKLERLAHRKPALLSGGEKQLVAIARAVASNPKILLMDEPFGHLDYRTAGYLRLEFKQLQKRLGITTLFVTHNLIEAKELGNRITVMHEGRLEQVIEPQSLEDITQGMDGFLERPNILKGTSGKSLGNGLIEFHWLTTNLILPDEGFPFDYVMIRPQNIYVSKLPPPDPPINRLAASVHSMRPTSEGMSIALKTDTGAMLKAVMETVHFQTLNLKIGDQVFVILKLRGLRGIRKQKPPVHLSTIPPTRKEHHDLSA